MISYIRWGGSFREFSPLFSSGHIAVIDLMDEITPGVSVGQRYRELDPTLRSADAFVFRSSAPRILESLESDVILRDQLADTPLGVLLPWHIENKILMTIKNVEGFREIHWDVSLNDLREVETRFMIREADAILEHEGAHFALPNRGTHAGSFIQLSYVMNSMVNVERLSNWIAPFIGPKSAIIADTPQLTSLLMKLRLDALSEFGVNIPAMPLDVYPVDITPVQNAVLQLAHYGGEQRDVVLVMSVNSSGRLARLFRMVTEADVKVVVLCQSKDYEQPDDVEVLCRIPVERWEVGSDGECPKCSTLETIFVDPRTFECKPSQKPEILKPDMEMVGKNLQFWEWVNEAGGVQLHKSVEHIEEGKKRRRHHGIYFEIEKLLSVPGFRQVCLSSARTMAVPELVVIPEHKNSALMKEFAREAFGESSRVVVTPARLNEEAVELVRNSTQVLLLDDSFVTGTTLIGLKVQIYQCWQNHGLKGNLEVFVALARPSGDTDRKKVLRPFFATEDRKPHVRWGHFLYVPGPGETWCPWCQERFFLEKNRRMFSGSSRVTLEERIRLLEGSIQRLPLFASADRLSEDAVTFGSFFGDLNEKEAFAAASCVAHELGSRVDSSRGLFVSPTVDLSLIVDAYYEAVFLAGMLRTLRARHLRPIGFSREFISCLRDRPARLSYPGTVGELAWASIQGKIAPQPIFQLLERKGESASFLGMLTRFLRMTSNYNESPKNVERVR